MVITNMTPKDVLDPDVSWKAKGLYWLFSQGPATAILLLILWGVHINLPMLVEHITAGYRENAAELHKSATVYQKNTDRLYQQLMDDRKIMIELARENRQTVQELGDRLLDEPSAALHN